MALLDIENDEGVTRMAVPFLDARRDGGVTNESMHRNAYNLVDGFITKYKVPIVRENGEDLLVGTYSFRARNGMLATVAKTWDKCWWLSEPTNRDAISHLSKTLSEVELCMKISRHSWFKAKSGKAQTFEC